MKTFPPDPLSTEERELAKMLARLSPHGVPSPEIDAQILSASHDAVAGPRAVRPRWPVAIGLAASMVLAVGVAWQLGPAQHVGTAEQSASTGAWSGADAAAAPPAPAPALADALPAVELRSAEAAPAPPPAPPTAPATARVEPSPSAPAATARPAEETKPAAAALPQKNLTPPAPPAAPPAAAAPSVMPSGSAQQSRMLDAAAAQRQETLRQAQAPSASDAGSASDAVAPVRRGLRVAPTSERVHESTSAGPAYSIRSRRTDLQVPVAADAQLQVGDWLERVRTRYGLGDEQAARRSLLLFVQDHPSEPVPGDLEPLLDQ